jgi:outer membrane protein assembly factor BamE (lipoprotein component of BamABCDE complex)
MRTKLAAASMVLALGLVACGGKDAATAPDAGALQKLTQGMPEAEVRAVLGEPARVQEIKYDGATVSHTWYYGSGDGETTVVIIDGKLSNAYGADGKGPLFAEAEEALDDGDDGG